VSCSPSNLAALAIGIALASVSRKPQTDLQQLEKLSL
jgi:hypothetical protein